MTYQDIVFNCFSMFQIHLFYCKAIEERKYLPLEIFIDRLAGSEQLPFITKILELKYVIRVLCHELNFKLSLFK